MSSAVVNGVRFNVQRQAAAPPGYRAAPQVQDRYPVAFVHGIVWDDLSSFAGTLAPAVCSSGREAILYDLRGHGHSQRTPSGYRLDDAVNDLGGILDQLDVDGPVHLVGRSYGGAVALAAALRWPRRVASLALIESHVTAPGWGKQIADQLIDVAVAVDDENVNAWLETNGDPKLRHCARVAAELVDTTTIVGDMASAAPLPTDSLRHLDCPVLAVYGAESERSDAGHELHRTLPDCRLELLPGHDDAVLEHATDTVRDLLVRWLDETETVRPRR